MNDISSSKPIYLIINNTVKFNSQTFNTVFYLAFWHINNINNTVRIIFSSVYNRWNSNRKQNILKIKLKIRLRLNLTYLYFIQIKKNFGWVIDLISKICVWIVFLSDFWCKIRFRWFEFLTFFCIPTQKTSHKSSGLFRSEIQIILRYSCITKNWGADVNF